MHCSIITVLSVWSLKTFPILQAENILLLELDLPTRTTKVYEEPVIAPKVAAALEDALRDEDEIQVDASTFHSTDLLCSSASSVRKPKSRWAVCWNAALFSVS